MGSPIDRTNKTALDANLVNGITSDAPKIKANNDTLYNYVDGLNQAQGDHAGAAVLAHPDGSVTRAKIANGAVGTDQLGDGVVTANKVQNGSLTADKFVPGLLNNESANGLAIAALQEDSVIIRMSKLLQPRRIKGVAHRGVSTVAPENTMPAFKLAADLGFFGVEFDIYKISDGSWVVMHDSTVDRTTDGTGSLLTMTLEEVKALDAGSWWHAYYAGTQVPTLQEVLTFCAKTGLVPFVEIKDTISLADAQEVVNIIDELIGLENVVIDSMIFQSLANVRTVSPNVLLGVHADATQDTLDFISVFLGHAMLIPVYTELQDQDKLDLLIDNNITFGAYTIDSNDLWRTLQDTGISFILTGALPINGG